MNPDYPALAQWARPDEIEPPLKIKASSAITYPASVFIQNIDRVRALAVLPGVVAAHAYGPDVDLLTGARRVELSQRTLWVGTGTNILFASVVIGAWTAFEVLAGDAWKEALNRYPILGIRALDAEPLPDDSDQQRERKAQKTVSVVAQRLLNPDFDLRRRMGDVLSDCFPMTSFSKIIAAYKIVFRDERVCEIIRDVGVRSLSAIRNVLVHSAGRADDDFVKQVRGDQRFATVQPGETLELNGHVTSELVDSARTQGFKLIEFVDRWCNDQTGKTKSADT